MTRIWKDFFFQNLAVILEALQETVGVFSGRALVCWSPVWVGQIRRAATPRGLTPLCGAGRALRLGKRRPTLTE